jgi:hypothetical protein
MLWLLAAGCWLLAAGCWLLDVSLVCRHRGPGWRAAPALLHYGSNLRHTCGPAAARSHRVCVPVTPVRRMLRLPGLLSCHAACLLLGCHSIATQSRAQYSTAQYNIAQRTSIEGTTHRRNICEGLPLCCSSHPVHVLCVLPSTLSPSSYRLLCSTLSFSYTFQMADIPQYAILTSIAHKPLDGMAQFLDVWPKLKPGTRVPVQYHTLGVPYLPPDPSAACVMHCITHASTSVTCAVSNLGLRVLNSSFHLTNASMNQCIKDQWMVDDPPYSSPLQRTQVVSAAHW